MASLHPRVELHVHLDGSISPSTLLRVSQTRNLTLPGIHRVPTSVADIYTAIYSMGEVWAWFDLVNEIIAGDYATLKSIAEDFVAQQASLNISYTEVRYDPVRPSVSHLANASISVKEAVLAVQDGLRAGCAKHGVEVHQLLCAMRGKPASQCYFVANLAAELRSGEVGGVVGLDLAGDEGHYNNSFGEVEACFAHAKTVLRLNTTVHAGEMADDEYGDVETAVQVMKADRVGHGYAAVKDWSVLQMLINQNVHVEACPAGHHDNLNATGVYHHLGVNFGLSTDDPAAYFMNVTLQDVEDLVTARLGFTPLDISRAYRKASLARFAPSAARIVAEEAAAAKGPTPAILGLAALVGFCLLAAIPFVYIYRGGGGSFKARTRGRVGGKRMLARERHQRAWKALDLPEASVCTTSKLRTSRPLGSSIVLRK